MTIRNASRCRANQICNIICIIALRTVAKKCPLGHRKISHVLFRFLRHYEKVYFISFVFRCYNSFKARFIPGISVASNAIQTIHNETACLIIYCLNCIRRDGNLTYKMGLKASQSKRMAALSMISLPKLIFGISFISKIF